MWRVMMGRVVRVDIPIAHRIRNHDDELVQEIPGITAALIATFTDPERQLQATPARQRSARLTSGQGNAGTPMEPRKALGGSSCRDVH